MIYKVRTESPLRLLAYQLNSTQRDATRRQTRVLRTQNNTNAKHTMNDCFNLVIYFIMNSFAKCGYT